MGLSASRLLRAPSVVSLFSATISFNAYLERLETALLDLPAEGANLVWIAEEIMLADSTARVDRGAGCISPICWPLNPVR